LPRKAAPIVRARQPKPAHKSNGHAVATAPAQEETSVIAVLEDGRVAVFAGERIVHMLEPQIVRRIVDLVARLSVKP
jgi:hypothetical protein